MPEIKQLIFAKMLPDSQPTEDETKEADRALILELGRQLSELLTGSKYHIKVGLWTRTTEFYGAPETQRMLNADVYEVEEE